MSNRKDPGTALVPVRLEPLDLEIVPRIGYDELALIESHFDDAKRGLVRSAGASAVSGLALAIGIFLTGATPLGPLFILAAILVSFGLVGAMGSAAMTCFGLLRLARASRMRRDPEAAEQALMRYEGEMRGHLEEWNRRAKAWNEAWDLLCKEEEETFALADRCKKRKSLEGLIKRIEYIRKEKRKHLKVRQDLVAYRERVTTGIERLRTYLPATPEPLYLTDGDEDE